MRSSPMNHRCGRPLRKSCRKNFSYPSVCWSSNRLSVCSHDRNDHFKNPVSKVDVPDYFDIIKQPMCWNMIDAKLDRHEYWDLQAFKVGPGFGSHQGVDHDRLCAFRMMSILSRATPSFIINQEPPFTKPHRGSRSHHRHSSKNWRTNWLQ